MTRCSRTLAGCALIGALVLATACGSSGKTALSGSVRSPKLQVGSVLLDDVRVSTPGTPFPMHARRGELLVVFFGYTHCPDICPVTLSGIRVALGRLGADARRVEIAFVTVDPAHDTPAVLRKFVGQFFAGAHLLRPASAAQLVDAKRAFLVSSKVQMDGSIDHSSSVAVVDAHGTELVEWPYGITPASIAHDLRALLAEAA